MTGPLPDLRPHIAEIAPAILGEPNGRLSTRTQLRFGTNGSVAVEIAGKKRGEWYDHEAESGGGPWELLTAKGPMTTGDAIGWLRSRLGIDLKRNGSRKPVAAYDYRDESGELLFQVCRFEPKTFRQRRPDGKGGWTWNVKGIRRVLYRLAELLAAPADCVAFVVEGEKDVDRLASLGLVATCNPGGAGKWWSSFNVFFKGRDVAVLPDNDDAGRAHARSVATNLAPVARSVRILELPDLPPRGDVSDWFAAGGTCKELQRLAAKAPAFSAEDAAEAVAQRGNTLDDGAEIARLAKLPLIAYGRERKDAAARLGCSVSILDRAVAAERGNGAAAGGQGRSLDLPKPQPWPRPVDGAMLLGRLVRAIQRFVVLDPSEADAVALWVLAAHAFDVWVIFPRLFVNSPEKGCGKSTLLDVLSRLVPKPLLASSITAAALFRVIEVAHPTLLLDEADSYARDNEDLRGVLDAGHRRDGAVIRTVGDNHEPRQFSAWAPVALAAIGHLPGTIEDRSIIVRLRRRRPDEPIQSFRLDRASRAEVLARMAARWAADHMAVLAAADPALVAGIYNRAADNWRPLLAVADLAGGGWPARARRAVVAFSSQGEDSDSARVLLLADLRELFADQPNGVLFTREILLRLHARDDRPWPEWKAGKPITGRQVAALLKPLGITTNQTVRRSDATEKGYRCEWFQDAFARYLLPCQSVTRSQAADSTALDDFRSVTPEKSVTDMILENQSISAGCDRVTDRKPLWWRDDDSKRPDRDPEEAVWME